MLPGDPELHALGAGGAVALLAVAQLVVARRWDGLPLLVWSSTVALLLAPPLDPLAWGAWGVVALCTLATVVRRPEGLGRADRLAYAVVLSGVVTAAWSFGLDGPALVGAGAVVAIGLAALTMDRRPAAWRTRWVGEIPVTDREG